MNKLRYSLDTSFVVRLLTGDPVPQFRLAADFLEQCGREEAVAEVVDLVLAEAYFALQYHYGFPKDMALKSLRRTAFGCCIKVRAGDPVIVWFVIRKSGLCGFADSW